MTIKTRRKKVSQKTVSRTGNKDPYLGDIDWHFCLTGCRFSHLTQNVFMFRPLLLGRGGVVLVVSLSVLGTLSRQGTVGAVVQEETGVSHSAESHW